MDLERVEQLIAAYGAEPARWPAGERAEAERLASGADLAAGLEAERALDAALDAYAAEAPSLALRQRILVGAPRPRQTRAWRPSGGFWLSGASLAAACVVGVVFGVSLGGAMAGSEAAVDRDTEASSAFGAVTVFSSPIDVDRKG